MNKCKIILVACFLFGIINCFGQTVYDTDGLNNLNNVYLYSLKKYCTTVDSSKIKVIYVIRESFVGNSWPIRINTFDIKYITGSYIDIITANGGSLIIVGISPLEFRNDNFYVSVIPFRAAISKNNVTLSQSSSLNVSFKYYNKNKKIGLVYKSKKWFGI